MKTNHKTTFVLLDRGTEDRQLYKELELLIGIACNHFKISISKEANEKFPMAMELKRGLRDEIDNQE